VKFQTAEFIPTGIDRIDSDKATTLAYRPNSVEDFPNIDVAVIDGRVLPTHPDINVFRTQIVGSSSSTSDSHGTHVAGTIGARDNLGGVVGIIPGARIWSVVVCSTTTCPAVLSGIDYVTANAASIEVANISIACGGGTFGQSLSCPSTSADSTAMSNARNAGITVVVGSGNDRRSANSISFCDLSTVICVSALADYDGKCGGLQPSLSFTREGTAYTQADDSIAYFSNYGSAVDIMAPGYSILSTDINTASSAIAWNQVLPFIGASIHGGYGVKSGTSMAAPHVAGAAALVKLNNPSFTPAQILTDLQAKAYPQTQSCDGSSKGGLSTGANARSSEKILNVQPY
jgi:subtilisin family serine protease